ncbi:hypothetical protein ACNQ21_00345 [Mycoplasma sp. VS299A]|uniref:hypothetical protein n=1 Tax=Mycoplasma sp. VS299A TaxID=3401690 RepID=UPI003AB01126
MNKQQLNKEVKILEELKHYRKLIINSLINDLPKENKDLDGKEFIDAIHFLYRLKTFSILSDEILQDELNDVKDSFQKYDNVNDILDNYQFFCKNHENYADDFFNKYIKRTNENEKALEERYKNFSCSNTRDRLNFLYINDIQTLYQLSKIKDLDKETYISILEKMNINNDILDRNQIQNNEYIEKTTEADGIKNKTSSIESR